MLILSMLACSILVLLLHSFFFFFSKTMIWDNKKGSVFECGFTSYFFSRFSFNSQYFIIALTFLFLDLELCFLMPFFNDENFNLKMNILFMIFSFILTLGLIYEWKMGLINWKN